ncbi:hypothetical protein [Vibrio marisflavi]|uniref:EF-hand domain-containing protein n=1 Tax=Vibrio marisflavi CECT 7928 TaxID=634439 RepID=A0ABN8DY00_9VIBR|nr:hypothetical protein [Vibrio marisflavi]CAH0536505.1 hypothetical protein VMF7928_00456 [Vibrio marisflavi CECT 7928]
MNKSILAGIFTTLIFSSSITFAQQAQHPRCPPTFEQLDQNGDGVLEKSEVKGPLARDFDKLDANEDGVLSQDELPEPPTHDGCSNSQ